MKPSLAALFPLFTLVLTPLLPACASSRSDSGASSPTIHLLDPPQSALAALIRTLEVMDAVRDPRATIRLRALECDSLIDRDRQAEYVRVVLDVTVLSEHGDDARKILQSLTEALEVEADATSRQESIAHHRVERVFHEMDWAADGLALGPPFARLVSLSEAIRVDVRPGDGAVPAGMGDTASADTRPMDQYIRGIVEAAFGDPDLVDVDVSVFRPREDIRDLQYHVLPVPESRFSKAEIGEFLYELEAQSPGVTVTGVMIAPYQPATDIYDDLWVFEADVSIRVQG